MNDQLDISQARKGLPGLVRRLQAGAAPIELTRYGKVVAVLSGPPPEVAERVRGAVDEQGNLMARPMKRVSSSKPHAHPAGSPAMGVIDDSGQQTDTTIAMDTAEAVVTKARRPGHYTDAEMEEIRLERLKKMAPRRTKAK